MIKRIMFLRVAAVALAAPALFASPAAADPISQAREKIVNELKREEHRPVETSWRGDDYRSSRTRERLNRWGQNAWLVRELRKDAVRACQWEVADAARQMGHRDIDFDFDQDIYQFGRYGFSVTFYDVELESRRGRSIRTDVTCEIDRGYVIDIDGLPLDRRGHGYGPGGRFGSHDGYGYRSEDEKGKAYAKDAAPPANDTSKGRKAELYTETDDSELKGNRY